MYLTQGLHRSVQQTPDHPAVIGGGRTRTFAELAGRVARLAGGLRRLGVGAGDRVAILSLNSDRYAEYLLGVPWAGAVLNPVNIRWSPGEIAYSLQDSGTEVLLVDDRFLPAVPVLRDKYSGLRAVIHCGDGAAPEGTLAYERLVAEAEPVEDAHRSGDDVAGIFYTGGTTGFPKGVRLTHANMIISALGSLATGEFLTPGGRFLHAAPMFHLADLAAWTGQLVMGGTHVIVPMFDPAAVAKAIEAHRVTDVLLVPTMIQMLVDSPAIAAHDLSSLRRLIYGGSCIAPAVLARAMKALPRVRFTQAYGMTELGPIATILPHEDHQLDGPLSVRARSGGRAAPHADVRIVDPDGNDVPRGTVGEIIVRGGHVTPGYWHKPEETAAAIRDGWMHTGDGGRMDEHGYVYIVDRIKDMIVTGGENVYSTEVENAVAQHPAVQAVAVIGLPDPQWGECVHAVVVLRPGEQASAEEIREHTKSLIAGYKAPRTVDFVDALPVSGAGKVLKRELRALYHERAASGAPGCSG